MTGFIRFFDSKVIKWFIIGTYAYFCLIILIEVIRRYGFGASSPWGEMTARYAFVYLTYVAAAEGIRQGRHIRIDLLPNRLPPLVRRGIFHQPVTLPPFMILREVLGYRHPVRRHEQQAVTILPLLHLVAGADPLAAAGHFGLLVGVEVAGTQRPAQFVEIHSQAGHHRVGNRGIGMR